MRVIPYDSRSARRVKIGIQTMINCDNMHSSNLKSLFVINGHFCFWSALNITREGFERRRSGKTSRTARGIPDVQGRLVPRAVALLVETSSYFIVNHSPTIRVRRKNHSPAQKELEHIVDRQKDLCSPEKQIAPCLNLVGRRERWKGN